MFTFKDNMCCKINEAEELKLLSGSHLGLFENIIRF